MKFKNIQEFIEEFSIVLFGFIIGTIFLLIVIERYINGRYNFLVLRATIFAYLLAIIITGFRLYFVSIVKNLAEKLGFKHITPFFVQQRIEGHYKKNWFQIHYRSKETGNDPGVLRTYVKLQFKKKKRFDKRVLQKYRNYKLKDHNIIIIKHLKRPYKNYLLLKRSWYTFDEKKIKELMDFLIKVAEEAELKK